MNPKNNYLESQVKSATPSGLIILLYEGLIRFIHEAKENISSSDAAQRTAAATAVTKATNILQELNGSLNLDTDPAFTDRMSNLYFFFIDKLSLGLAERNPKHLDEILPLIEELLNAWKEAETKLQVDPPAQS
jgi:flagellar protein FliS